MEPNEGQIEGPKAAHSHECRCLLSLRQSHMLHHVDIFAQQLAWTESLSNNTPVACFRPALDTSALHTTSGYIWASAADGFRRDAGGPQTDYA